MAADVVSIDRRNPCGRGPGQGRGSSRCLSADDGALHKGHAALVRAARAAVGPNGLVVVSIFVNPT